MGRLERIGIQYSPQLDMPTLVRQLNEELRLLANTINVNYSEFLLVEGQAFTQYFTITARNNSDRPLRDTSFFGKILAVQYYSVEGSSVDCELRIAGNAVTCSPASPITVSGTGWVDQECTGNNEWSPGDNLSVYTSNVAVTGDEVVVGLIMDDLEPAA